MSQAAILRTALMFGSLLTVSIALGGAGAEARGAGIGNQPKPAPPSGRAVNALAQPQPLPLQADGKIVAEHIQLNNYRLAPVGSCERIY